MTLHGKLFHSHEIVIALHTSKEQHMVIGIINVELRSYLMEICHKT
jgi:hypothetical protein